MSDKEIARIKEELLELEGWLEDLHHDIWKLERGRNGNDSKDSNRPRVTMSFIDEIYGRDIEFDGSESGITMTPWDATMEFMESIGVKDYDDLQEEYWESANKLKFKWTWEDDAQSVYDDLLEILISKQKDYGPDNIRLAPGGPLNGLRVRLYDKIARLSNLLDTGATPENESLRDTFIDIANYGVIGVMILDDTFPKSKDA